MIIVKSKFMVGNYAGRTIWPFIFIHPDYAENNERLINHEKIHIRQQTEMLVLPFYIAYAISYLIQLAKYRNHDSAYYNIIFEREAYNNDDDLNYLEKRKFWAWVRS